MSDWTEILESYLKVKELSGIRGQILSCIMGSVGYSVFGGADKILRNTLSLCYDTGISIQFF